MNVQSSIHSLLAQFLISTSGYLAVQFCTACCCLEMHAATSPDPGYDFGEHSVITAAQILVVTFYRLSNKFKCVSRKSATLWQCFTLHVKTSCENAESVYKGSSVKNSITLRQHVPTTHFKIIHLPACGWTVD